jgi:vancomycin permeability regulator SanA
MNKNLSGGRRRHTIRTLLCVFLLVFAGHCAGLAIAGLYEANLEADAAVILGNTVQSDGQPAPRLAARLQRGLELWQNKRVKVIIVSGGIDADGNNEALVMKQWLVVRGVSSSSVIADEDGYTTMHTARNCRRLMDEHGLRSVITVSQYFHLARCRLALRKAGVPRVSSSYARYVEWRDCYSLPREVAAWYSYLLLK